MDTMNLGNAAAHTKRKYVQVVIDHHSRFVWAQATTRNTTDTVISVLRSIFSIVGKPRKIITDNGPNFRDAFSKFLRTNGIEHATVSPYHPQANGLVERVNGTIARGLRTRLIDKPNLLWSTVLPQVVDAYNDTPHRITGFTPRYLHLGIVACDQAKPVVAIDDARKLAVKRSRETQDTRAEQYNRNRQPSCYRPGDLVRYRVPANHPARHKLTPAFVAPCRIETVTGPETYTIAELDKNNEIVRKFKAHSSHLRPYFERTTTVDDDTPPANDLSIRFGQNGPGGVVTA